MAGKQNVLGAGRGLAAYRGDIIAQAIVVACVAGIAFLLASSLIGNLEARSIRTGFGFLWQGANFEIGQSLIPFTASSTYGMALLAGLINTICVAALAIVFSTLLGLVIGLAGLSRNPSVSLLAKGYVELVRNVPLLLQLYFLYSIFTQMLPSAANALNPVPGIFLDRSGLHFPVYAGMAANGFLWLVTGLGAALLFRRTTRTSDINFRGPVSLLLAFGPALVAIVYAAVTSSVDIPRQTKFGFNGGGTLPPELTALLLGLTLYNAAFIAEILRGGIKSVPSGQVEAATALGLGNSDTVKLVVLPQAMLVAIPPLANQYLNLTKNTSLAIAIGFPDLMSVTSTIINQTGQAVELIGIVMGAYLIISLCISAFMNWYNSRLVGRSVK